MASSATVRRRSTLRRITIAAQELTIERGYDGFPPDERAERVGVSRRTLFNHVRGKEEAVLGVRPDFDPRLVADFRAGGPTGDLFDDLLALIVELLDREDADRADAARFHQLRETNPPLTGRVITELDTVCAEAVALAADRPGESDPHRAQVVVSLLGALIAHAMHEFIREPDLDTGLVDHLRRAVDTARSVLA